MKKKKLTDYERAEQLLYDEDILGIQAIIEENRRLQSENNQRKEEFYKVIIDCDYWKSMHNVLADSFTKQQKENAEQKAEIERLTKDFEAKKKECREIADDYQEMGTFYYNETIKTAELQKQVDALKEQLKSVQNSCQSKNVKIKNLNAEKEALQNELNFQNGKPHYRYVIWNTKQNKRQFPSICEMTENGAYLKLFQKIGWDSAKYRFEAKRIKVDGIKVE